MNELCRIWSALSEPVRLRIEIVQMNIHYFKKCSIVMFYHISLKTIELNVVLVHVESPVICRMASRIAPKIACSVGSLMRILGE